MVTIAFSIFMIFILYIIIELIDIKRRVTKLTQENGLLWDLVKEREER